MTTTRTAPKPGPKRGPSLGQMTTDEAVLDLEFLQVTKVMAMEWLRVNASNRNIRSNKVQEFKRDMLADQWRNVGDPVRFDTNNMLADGQHRLIALVKANEEREAEGLHKGHATREISIPLLVIRGVKPEDRVVIDTGTKRTASDQLKMAGYANYPLLAAAAKWMIFWDRKLIYKDSTIKNVTHSEILSYVQNNPEFEEIVQEASKLVKGIDCPQGYVVAAYYICSRINRKAADDFFGRLSDGVGLQKGDPVLALRDRMRDLRLAKSNLKGEMWLSLLLRAWNARREGQYTRSMMVHRRGEPIACPIPK